MGTACSLRVYAEQEMMGALAAGLATAEVERIEAKYSRYDALSELSAINCAAELGESVVVDDETAGLLDYAFSCYRMSGGLFDVTSGILRRVWNFSSGCAPKQSEIDALLPLIGMENLVWERPRLGFRVAGMELDFGGIGKEYAVDRAARVLADQGVRHALIDLGGDLFALGTQPDGRAWKVGVKRPLGEGPAWEVELASGGLATSGDYERCLKIGDRRFGHILHPKTGWPVQGLSSVTAIADCCMVAGSMTTIAILKERDGVAWLSSLDVPHAWIDSEGRCGGNLGGLSARAGG